MESLLAAIYPGAAVKWDPILRIELVPGSPLRVRFPGFVFQPSGGTLHGATGIEIGDEKAQFIFNSEHFGQAAQQEFPTVLAVFEATMDGRVTRQKTLPIDASDPLSEIKSIQVSNAPTGTWPMLTVQYISHVVGATSSTQIEWQASFDPNSGKLVSRLPTSILTRSKAGSEQMLMLRVQRIDPSTVSITDMLSKNAVTYSCADPCLVDRSTLLSKWLK